MGDPFFLQSRLTKQGTLMNHSYRLGCKCAIKEPETCKGDANISLGINHAWFRGLALQIH